MLKPANVFRFSVLASLALSCFAGCATSKPNRWPMQKTASAGTAQAIGRPSAGCLAGAASLYADGPGYSVMRPSRKRFYGHTDLISFLTDLGKKLQAGKLGTLLIGDLAQPRGGLMPGGHASHQTGIDVDLWYLRPKQAVQALTLDARENLSAGSVLLADGHGLSREAWSREDVTVLRLAAEDARVERIFVNPVIKKELCATEKERSWLRKIRPWWGHDDHFHVRLLCPANSPKCDQAPLPPDEECGSPLDWWFTEEAKKQGAESGSSKPPVLPAECDALLEPAGG